MTQFYSVYLHPRDDDGQLKRTPRNWRPEPSEREAFFELWRQRGLREDLIEREWEEGRAREREAIRRQDGGE
jgi:hypothetical protein